MGVQSTLMPPAAPQMSGDAPLCGCGRPAKLVAGVALYGPTARVGASYWVCKPCGAAVGCHPGTTTPLGTLATPALRAWRREVHAALDPLWKGGSMSRGQAYAWLADLMGIPPASCHVGMMDQAWCERALQALTWMRADYREGR
jgi:hypothetical protein